jgi:hypothetical protein
VIDYVGIDIVGRCIYHLSLANRPRFFAIILNIILIIVLLLILLY